MPSKSQTCPKRFDPALIRTPKAKSQTLCRYKYPPTRPFKTIFMKSKNSSSCCPRFLRSLFSHKSPSISETSTSASAMVGLVSADGERELFVEVDPTGRYGRYAELLGCGAVKKVFRAFDQEEGIEVAWNQVKLGKLSAESGGLRRVYSEVELLRRFQSEHIIKLYAVWEDEKGNMLNFITEVCTSGDLREYRKKHRHVSLKALKKWCWQILKGLEYLHTNELCVIHRDLNCSNVFINGNTGVVKIGDLGLAGVVGKDHVAHSMLGTPEFMAPEVYEENYNELVDIYSFGMSVLEMVTVEVPYSECNMSTQVYAKVVSGIKPKALSKVKDAEVKAFIEKCLVEASVRPTASDLLQDPFLEGVEEQITDGIQTASCL